MGQGCFRDSTENMCFFPPGMATPNDKCKFCRMTGTNSYYPYNNGQPRRAWGDTSDQVSDKQFSWYDWQGLGQYQLSGSTAFWTWDRLREEIEKAPNGNQVRGLYCADAHDKSSTEYDQICNKWTPCDSGFFWCNIWQPLLDQVAGLLQTICNWIHGILGDENNPWFLKLAAYALKPVCWLLGYPNLAISVVIMGGVFILLAPFIDTALLVAK